MKRSHILITGASSGIGAALAQAYAKHGVVLSLGGRSRERLEAVAQVCKARGADVYTQVVDVADKKAMIDWISRSDSLYPLEMVIANAGISAGTSGSGESLQQVEAIFNTNLTGVIYTIAPAVALMQQRQKGQVVIMSSLASFRGLPGCPAYSASKAAVRTYGEALRGLLHAHNIGVTVVTPGYIRTPMTDVNTFPMPFLQEVDRAAQYIIKKLKKNPARIAFPKFMYSVVAFLGALPPFMTDWLYRALPGKGSGSNT